MQTTRRSQAVNQCEQRAIADSRQQPRTSPLPDGFVNSGLYVLLIRLTAPVRLRVGALGRIQLAPGWYQYTGSARRNLRQRVVRHLSARKRRRWHIDYLTSAGAARPLGALLVSGQDAAECALNQTVGSLVGHAAPAPRFGASDCRAGCPAHLWYSSREVTFASLVRRHSRSQRKRNGASTNAYFTLEHASTQASTILRGENP